MVEIISLIQNSDRVSFNLGLLIGLAIGFIIAPKLWEITKKSVESIVGRKRKNKE